MLTQDHEQSIVIVAHFPDKILTELLLKHIDAFAHTLGIAIADSICGSQKDNCQASTRSRRYYSKKSSGKKRRPLCVRYGDEPGSFCQPRGCGRHRCPGVQRKIQDRHVIVARRVGSDTTAMTAAITDEAIGQRVGAWFPSTCRNDRSGSRYDRVGPAGIVPKRGVPFRFGIQTDCQPCPQLHRLGGSIVRLRPTHQAKIAGSSK